MSDLLRLILFLPDAASTFAERVDDLHFFVIITTMVASAAVGLTAIFFFVRYRRRSEHQITEQVTGPLWLEMMFIFVPLAFFLTWFSVGFRDFVWLRSPPKDAMDIYVMGKQWMWKFSYPSGPNSVQTLHVPAGRPVRLLLTSRDVVHSFFVPEFRVKQDILPGRYTQVWFTATKPGTYQIFCTEYCGLEHSMMRGEVVVLPQQEFEGWLSAQRAAEPLLTERSDEHPTRGQAVPALASMADQGRVKAVAEGCLRCHSVDGTDQIGPTWRDLYGSEVVLQDGSKVIADEAYLTRSMMQPLDQIVRGFAPTMPSYQGKFSGAEAAALVEYIKSLRTQDATTLERISE